jgi:hypothetical protein
VESSCEHSNEPTDLIKCWEFLSICTNGGLSRRTQFHGVRLMFPVIDSTPCFYKPVLCLLTNILSHLRKEVLNNHDRQVKASHTQHSMDDEEKIISRFSSIAKTSSVSPML